MLPNVFQSFIERSPIGVMAQAVLTNLFQSDRLDALFERTVQRQYQKTLLFSTIVELMHSVVLGAEPNVYAAYRKRRHTIPVSDQAVYDKLNGMELGVSAALVHDAARQAEAVIDHLGTRRESWLPGYRVRVVDGNQLAATDHRLEPLRTTGAAPLPGRSLVVLDPQTGLATDVFLTPDGHAQERSLLEEVLAVVEPDDVWLADRQFCTLKFLATIAQKQGFFVIRQHGTLKGQLRGGRRFQGESPTGPVYEQAVDITFEGQVVRLRRVSVELNQPTQDGDAVLHLLTNLPAEVSAVTAAGLYHRRWSIEKLFFEVSTTLTCEVRTLCYPKAALFVFCLALMAANAVAVIKAAVQAAHGSEAADELSGYYLALEVRQVYAGLMIAIPAEDWSPIAALPVKAFACWLKDIAARMDLPRYRKTPRGPKKPSSRKWRNRNCGHVSTHKRLTGDDP